MEKKLNISFLLYMHIYRLYGRCLWSILLYPIILQGAWGITDDFTTIPHNLVLSSAALIMLEYIYFMPLRAIVKTVARGAVDDLIHYRPRPQGRGRCIRSSTTPRAIELTVVYIRHEIVVLLSNQCERVSALSILG